MGDDLQRAIAILAAENRRLSSENRTLSRQLADLRVTREKWRTLATATNLIVGCTGCGHDLRFPDRLTEEIVVEVETITRRLREYWEAKHANGVEP